MPPSATTGGSSSLTKRLQTYSHLPPAQPSPEELTLFTTLSAYADALDALPLDLTRSFSDLRELDAVLGAHLNSLTNRLIHLAALIEDPNVSPGERIVALKEVAEEARSYKMGGEDKIRVALNTAETIISHTTYIDMLLANFASVPSLAPLLNPPSQSHVAGHLSDGTPLAPGSGPGGNNPANTYTEVITPNTKRKKPVGAGQNASGGLLNGMAHSAAILSSGADKNKGQDVIANTQTAAPLVKKRKPPGQGAGPRSKPQGGSSNAGASAAQSTASGTITQADDFEDRKSGIKRKPTREEDDGTRGDDGRSRVARGKGNNARGSQSDEEDEDSELDSNTGGALGRPARVARASRPVHGQDNEANLLAQPSTIGEDADETRYCICNNVSYGDMIGCDDDNCQREWFHLGCVGLLKPPQGTWYCGDCTQRRAARSQKNKKAKVSRNGGAALQKR